MKTNLEIVREACGLATGGTAVREYSLADVLRAITKSKKGYINIGFSQSKPDIIYLYNFDGEHNKWDLTKDLSNQSDEVLKFLADILNDK